MKICRKCDHSVIAGAGRAREIHTKDSVPSMYLNCSHFGNRTCSYIKKSCEIHHEMEKINNNNASK